MLKLVIRSLTSHARRLIGTCSAVLLGVAFLSGTLILSDTLRATFDDVFTSANAGTDVVVRGAEKIGSDDMEQRSTVDASLVDRVRATDGVAEASPFYMGIGQSGGSDGETIGGEGPPTLAGNWVDDEALTPYELAEGRAPARRGEVVIDRGSAKDGKIAVGDTISVNVPDPLEVEVVGLLTFSGQDSLGGATYTALHVDDAAAHLSVDPGKVDQILVRAADGVTADELATRLGDALPDTTEVITSAELTDEQTEAIGDDFLNFFEMFLLVFTGVALLVATFSINNTFTVILAQRARESALLRAIGATRAQVLRAISFEAFGIGVVASALGLFGGLGLAFGLQQLLNAVGFDLPSKGLVIEPASLVIAGTIGLVVTMVAALAPAVKASKVPPLAALRDVAVERSSIGTARTIAAVLLGAGGIGLVTTATIWPEGAVLRAGLGAVATMIAMVVTGPIVARRAAAIIGAPIAAVRGRTGGLSRQNAMRSPRRTAATSSALMVGVGVVTLFVVFGASIKASVDESVAGAFRGDLVVSSNQFSGAGFSPQMLDEIRELDEVGTVLAIGDSMVRVDGEDESLTIVDPADVDAVLDLDVSAGSFADLRDDQLAVSEDEAADRGWALGDSVELGFVDGAQQTVTVGALYGTKDLMGSMILPEAAWLPHATQQMVVAALIDLGPGVDSTEGATAVNEVTDRFNAPDVMDRDEYVESIAGEIDQLLGLVYALLALSIVIALMGIGNTLSLSIHERVRELGLLRAVGQTRAQMRSMVRWESVIVALYGTLAGVALGTFLGWGVVRALAAQEGLGTLAVPTSQIVVVVLIGALAGVLAGLRPARRAARLDILEALAAG